MISKQAVLMLLSHAFQSLDDDDMTAAAGDMFSKAAGIISRRNQLCCVPKND